MKGRVTFWFGLFPTSRPGLQGEGVVLFKLFGQRCRKCSSETFQKPLWYPKEVQKVPFFSSHSPNEDDADPCLEVVWNVFNKVSEVIYQVPSAAGQIVRERRVGKPQREHVSSDCEACALGICSSAKPNPSVPLPLPETE